MMLTSLRVENFRNLRHIEVGALGRVNLIAGRNNSGKTSLLEALSLLSGKGLDNSILRGRSAGHRGLFRQRLVEDAWKELFSDLVMERPISITGYYAQDRFYSLNISSRFDETESADDATTTRLHDSADLFEFQYKNEAGRIAVHRRGTDQRPHAPVTFLSKPLFSRTDDADLDASLLGQLIQQKRDGPVLKALQIIEPSLQSIRDNSATGIPMIVGDIGLPELTPLHVMGEGMTRLARLVLAIASTQGGVVLVDEIENGLHYSVLPRVWKVIDEAAEQSNVQVFATTHSAECVKAAHQSLSAESFRYHRLDYIGLNNRVVTYDWDSIEASIEYDGEIR